MIVLSTDNRRRTRTVNWSGWRVGVFKFLALFNSIKVVGFVKLLSAIVPTVECFMEYFHGASTYRHVLKMDLVK